MYITYGRDAVELKTWSSEQEMRDYVLARLSDSLILGEDSEQYCEFYSIDFHLELSGLSSFRIGLISEGHGLVPYLLLIPERNEILLGFNCEVVCLHVAKKSVKFRLEIDSLFHRFVHLFDDKGTLVFHEFGVMLIDDCGNIQWRYDKDIIINCSFEGEILRLHFYDDTSIRLHILTGNSV